MVTKRTIIATVIFIIVLAVLVYYLFFHAAKHKLSFLNHSVNVSVAKPQQKNIPQTISAIGKVIAPQTVLINSQQAGRVTHINFTPGKAVKKGQVLLQLDNAVQKAQLAQAKANYEQALSDYHRYERMHDLYAQSVSREVLSEKLAAMKVAQAALQNANAQLQQMTIRAPFSGTIAAAQSVQTSSATTDSQTQTQITLGSYLNAGDGIVALTNPKVLEIEYMVPQHYASLLHLGQHVIATTSAYQNKQFKARVQYISPLLLQTGANYVVRAVIESQQQLLKPGMFVYLKQVVNAQRKILAVPALSLVPAFDGYTVYTIKDNKVQSLPVKTGENYAGYVAILSGLKPSQSIITEGTNKVEQGSSVKVISS